MQIELPLVIEVQTEHIAWLRAHKASQSVTSGQQEEWPIRDDNLRSAVKPLTSVAGGCGLPAPAATHSTSAWIDQWQSVC